MNRNITDTDYSRNNLPENTLQSQGNMRVEFKEDADGEATITQENHYYPFGMRFSGEVFANNDNDFRYKESQQDIPWKAKNYSSFSIEGVGGLLASNPETSVIFDVFNAISGAHIGTFTVMEDGSIEVAFGDSQNGRKEWLPADFTAPNAQKRVKYSLAYIYALGNHITIYNHEVFNFSSVAKITGSISQIKAQTKGYIDNM